MKRYDRICSFGYEVGCFQREREKEREREREKERERRKERVHFSDPAAPVHPVRQRVCGAAVQFE